MLKLQLKIAVNVEVKNASRSIIIIKRNLNVCGEFKFLRIKFSVGVDALIIYLCI